MSGQAATARLNLDASGFDRQASSSFREFSKSLQGVKDSTDVALKGAEALQKTFVKSLAGTAAIGAATVLADSMRDVGRQIGEVGNSSMTVIRSISGVAQSMEDGAARAQKLSEQATSVANAMEALKNSSMINAGIFSIFGGEKVMRDLEDSLKGLSAAELLSGTQSGAKASKERLAAASSGGKDALTEFDRKAADEAQMKQLKASQGYLNATVDQRRVMEENLRIQQDTTRETERLLAAQLKANQINENFEKLKAAALEKRAEAEQTAADAQRQQLAPAERLIAINKELESVKKAAQENDPLDPKKGLVLANATEQFKKQEALEKRRAALEKQRTDALAAQSAEQQKSADLQKQIDKMQAEAKGPKALLEYLTKQAEQAEELAKSTGKLEDKLAALEAAKTLKDAQGNLSDPAAVSSQKKAAFGSAATDILNIASNNRGLSGAVEKERARASAEVQRQNMLELDKRVKMETSATSSEGGARTMVNRRREFIRNQAQKEAGSQKTLADVYSVLDQALQKLTSAPVVTA